MVIICKDKYDTGTVVPTEVASKMEQHFSEFPFELSDFQKYALTGIVEGDHVLVTAHTGSGKTLPAEFSIKHFCSLGKKVIYTSPIKALSNQKFYEFTKQFPDLSVGILTGDIKFNPEADVLIMTTEILQNNLYQRSQHIELENLHFNLDIESELGCVVYDEVHYINDADRGRVWEESMMMLPAHVQMVMLSATIDKSHIFAKWCEDRHPECPKQVWLAPTDHRVVPLTHYNYVVTPDGFYKHERDKEIQKMVRGYCDDFHVIRDSAGRFIDETSHKTHKILKLIEKHKIRIPNEFVIESVLRFLNQRDMLPAIFFVFSRKNVERFAKNVSISLFPPDSKIPSIMEHECTTILRKLPNYNEYINLPEFKFILGCLEKGIGVHHSGIIPVFREMIELLFSKGYIRALFATETFAVGINMPTKTVVFTSLSKFTDKGNRWIMSHEYTQMAGRAGRRGLDTEGHVIHLNNMMWGSSYPETDVYRGILNGVPQTLTSKFSVNFDIILNMIEMGVNYGDLETYSRKSMLSGEMERMMTGISGQIETIENNIANTGISDTDYHKLGEYRDLEESMKTMNGNKRKKLYKSLTNISSSVMDFDKKKSQYNSLSVINSELAKLKETRQSTQTYFGLSIRIKCTYLSRYGYIEPEGDGYKATLKGTVSMLVREAPSLTTGDLFEDPAFLSLTSREIVGLLSCFTNIRVCDDMRAKVPPEPAYGITYELSVSLKNMRGFMVDHYINQTKMGIYDVSDDPDKDVHFDIITQSMEWYDCENEQQCRILFEKIKGEIGVFPGEFVKAILKINNICLELQNVCEAVANVEFKHRLSTIPEKILKFIATNQSLYI